MRAASSVSILLKQVGEGEKFVQKRPKTVECLVAIHLSSESKPRGIHMVRPNLRNKRVDTFNLTCNKSILDVQ